MALNETLRTTPPMLLRDYSTLTPAEQKKVMTETLPEARKQSRQLQEQEAMQTIEQTKQMETAGANELRRQGRVGQQQIEKAFGELREPEPFVAPKRSPEELASTAFGDLIASLMVGGIAKASAISQLEAIKGMQEARAKNDQLAVDVAYKNWEIAEKQKETFNKRVLDKLNRIRELMPYEKEAAMREINLLKPELSGGIAQTKLARGDIDGAIKAVEKQRDTIEKNAQKMRELEFQRGTQERIANIRAATSAGKGGKAGQHALIFASRVYGNILGAAQDLGNVVNLPATAESPLFAGLINRDPETAFGSLKAAAARNLTREEERAFDQVANSLSAALARLEAQGLASGGTKANIASFDALKPRKGDNAANVALWIARVKQEIETGINVHDKMPGATPEQKAEAQRVRQQLNQIVPYTVDNVMAAIRGKGKPLDEKMSRLVQQKPIVEQTLPSEITKDGKVYELQPNGKYKLREEASE